MRIITGKLKGRNIPVPNTDLLRPTSDRTKEGIFSVIDARRYFDNTRVLDLFAGSGNLGFEAISRGAANALFVDQEAAHLKQIEKTAKIFDVENQISTVTLDTETFLERKEWGSFDFIFADPPYDYFWMVEMVDQIMESDLLKKDGYFVLEHDKRHDFSDHPLCRFSKPYGRTVAAIFRHTDEGFK